MSLICKILAEKNERLYKELGFSGICSNEKQYKIRLEIIINLLELQEYEYFWPNIEIAENYAERHVPEDLLPIKLIKLVVALKQNPSEIDLTEIEQLKNELQLHYFDNSMLSQIKFEIDDYSGLRSVFEKFFADIYLLFYNLPESYYQELRVSEEAFTAHYEKTLKLMQSLETKEKILHLCSIAAAKIAIQNQQDEDAYAIGYLFARLLFEIFKEQADSLANIYLEKTLSNIPQKLQKDEDVLRGRAELIIRYKHVHDTEKTLKHGWILMENRDVKDFDRIILTASQIFIGTWDIYNTHKNKPSQKEKNKMLSYVEENLRICLNIYFTEHNIIYTGSNKLPDMYSFFKKDVQQNNRTYIPYINDYVSILSRYANIDLEKTY